MNPTLYLTPTPQDIDRRYQQSHFDLMKPNLEIGHCFSINFGNNHFGLICSSIDKKRSPHSYSFLPISHISPEPLTINDFLTGNFYATFSGVSSSFDNPEQIIKNLQPDIETIWETYPQNYPYNLMAYNIMILRKDFLKMQSLFTNMVGRLHVIDNLVNYPTGSVNGGSEEVLSEFLSDLKPTMEYRNQKEFAVEHIVKAGNKR